MWLYILASSVLLIAAASADNEASQIYLRNDSDRMSKVSWINTETGGRIFMFEASESSTRDLSSFVGHQFEVEEAGGCERGDSCLADVFMVSSFPSQCKFDVMRRGSRNEDRRFRCI
jgi:hypothetical protein